MDNEQLYKKVEAARFLIKNKKNWTKGAEARDINGTPVNINNPFGVSFCLVGALLKNNSPKNIITFLHKKVEETTNFDNLVEFNDSSSHEEVINFLDTVLKECNHG